MIQQFKAENGACIALDNELVTLLEGSEKTILQVETKDTGSSRTETILKQMQAFICTFDTENKRGVLMIEQNPAFPFQMTELERFHTLLTPFHHIQLALRETEKRDSLCITLVLYAPGVKEMVERFLGRKVVVNEGKGEFYELHPQNEQTYGWPESWPSLESPAVFIIFDKYGLPIYVGETSNVGKRLSDFFRYAADRKKCRPVQDTWQREPDSLQVFEIQDDKERQNLKKYLIDKLKPIENANGKR